jgi:TolA-binding protein
MKRLLVCLVFVVLFSSAGLAQEFEIKKYEINARVVPAELKVDVQAKLRLVNLSDASLADKVLLSTAERPRFSFFINPKAKVTEMKVNGAAVPLKTAEDARNNLLRISTDITTTIASARELEVDFVYSIPAADRSTSLHVSSGESFLLPGGFWVPTYHTPYAEHGADTAPVSLTVAASTGLKVISSGVRKSENSFEQSLAAQPFFIVGDYDVVTRGGEAYPVEVYVPRGMNEIGKQQAQRLAAEAERIVAFYAKYFNVAATAPFRLVATQARQLSTVTSDAFYSSREVSYATVGAVTVDDNLFRRDVLDLGTIELIAGAAARTWIDGQVLLRGRGTGMLRDALPIYLGAQYLGERFGEAQREAAFDRYRRAYAIVARNDAPLLMQSPLDRNYTTSVYNKGAVVWRLLEKQMGKQNFDNVLRASLSRTKVDALSLGGWYQQAQAGRPAQIYPLCSLSRCASFKDNLLSSLQSGAADRRLINEIFANWIETVVLPDFAIGQPQKAGSGVESTIANFGSGDVTIDVIATTDKGEKLKRNVTIKAGEYGTVSFPAGTNIVTIEADPDNLYLQSDYANDIFPRRPSQSEAFGQANLAFSKNDFTTAETKAREGLKAEPNAPTLQALLGRVLLAQKKTDEAAKTFDSVLKSEPLPLQAYGAANLGLAEIALQQNNFAEAARRFRFAAMSDFDAATTIAARDGAAKAERGANAIKIPDDVRAFLQKFDGAVLQGTADAVNQFIELGNLRKFAQSLVVRKPATWVTEAIRTEEWDANRTAVDVTLKIKIEGKDYAGRAVYIVSRGGGKMLLSEVPVFDVK